MAKRWGIKRCDLVGGPRDRNHRRSGSRERQERNAFRGPVRRAAPLPSDPATLIWDSPAGRP